MLDYHAVGLRRRCYSFLGHSEHVPAWKLMSSLVIRERDTNPFERLPWSMQFCYKGLLYGLNLRLLVLSCLASSLQLLRSSPTCFGVLLPVAAGHCSKGDIHVDAYAVTVAAASGPRPLSICCLLFSALMQRPLQVGGQS